MWSYRYKSELQQPSDSPGEAELAEERRSFFKEVSDIRTREWRKFFDTRARIEAALRNGDLSLPPERTEIAKPDSDDPGAAALALVLHLYRLLGKEVPAELL
jgi:hypothetical protein